jgi:hypothetical protein
LKRLSYFIRSSLTITILALYNYPLLEEDCALVVTLESDLVEYLPLPPMHKLLLDVLCGQVPHAIALTIEASMSLEREVAE